ncbi:hypothetical protein IFM89_032456 [Coptis chinensis]|uniref:Protein kinase domain-containing protein n=1 Tax=Coptis chinensis TaxID=261450 RepID=A0A835M5I8_9MAGN|nr:hypothetical protein IFM89_032456 [Coptis chinensis]
MLGINFCIVACASVWYKEIPVAIKILQRDVTTVSPESKEKFLREVTVLSRVKHDNLVKFIGASLQPYMLIVTELMKGGSLKKYLWDMRPRCPDLQTSLNFALEIARVMECLHSNGIIHRDLKPGNVLLTEDQTKVKLADFGLARKETVTEAMSTEIGTYRWMAPELCSTTPLLRGEKKHYDHKVDIYSFSMVLWELLTNLTPFTGMTSIQAAYAVASRKLRPTLDKIPSELIPLLESSWAEDPVIRPEFKDIIITLSNILGIEIPHTESAETTPTAMNISEPQNFDQAADSPGTRHLMDRSEDMDGRKSRSSSPRFLSCFEKCFTH